MAKKETELELDSTIWDRLQVDNLAPLLNKTEKEKEKEKENKKRNRYLGIIGTVLGSVFWLYFIIQSFFYNLDNLISTKIPSIDFLVDYKFFVFLGLATLCAITIKRYYLVYLYILFFPLILFLWKIPLLIYRFKSWLLVLTIIETITSLFYKFKTRLIVITASLFSFLVIFVSSSKPLLLLAVLALSLVSLFTLARTVYLSYKTSIFFSFQSKLIGKFRKSGIAQSMITVDSKVKKSKTKKLTKEQSTAILSNIQMSLLFNRSIYFWAYQLEKYKQSRIGFILSGVSYVWLYIKLGILLGFINYALYKIEPTNFIIHNTDSFINFLYYSFNSMFFNEIGGILANSDTTIVIRIVSGITGILLIGVLALNFVYVAKQTKNDDELTRAIKDIKDEGKELEKHIKSEFQVTTAEAIEKLAELKAGMLTLILKITSQLPDDFK